jgi:hypothetical protein
MAVGPIHIASAWTAHKTSLQTVTPLLCVIKPLLSNGCFSGSIVLALRKYATIFNASSVLMPVFNV